MRVVIAKSFGSYRRGQTFDWQPSFARILIGRGLVEPLESAEEIESADLPEDKQVRTATIKNKPARRRKPR